MEYSDILRWVGIIFLGAGGIMYWYFKKGNSFSFSSNRTGTQHLDTFATDITLLAKEGKIDPVVGREDEIKRVTQILTRRTKNNVVLVGPSGVGKTAIVEGLALKIVTKDVPTVLQHKRVLSLGVAELLAGTKYRGEFEQRVKHIVDDIRRSNRTIILFVDEIHTVNQTKGTEGAVNLADILKSVLARGDLQLIGATTEKEYEQYIQPDESWERRFQKVLVDEPTVEEAIQILYGLKQNYENYHHVQFTDEALKAAVSLSQEYIKGRQLPDKAIDLIDEAGAMVNVNDGAAPDHAVGLLHSAASRVAEDSEGFGKDIRRLKDELTDLRLQEDGATAVDKLAEIRKKIVSVVKLIEEKEATMRENSGWPVVDTVHIKEVVAEWIGMTIDEIH